MRKSFQIDDERKGLSSTLQEIVSAIPAITKTRWRKKSDFYTLFLLMAEHSSKFPLPGGKRKRLGKALIKFSDDVDTYLSDPDNHSGMSRSIKDYGAAVERAASDLTRRKTRRAELAKVVSLIVS